MKILITIWTIAIILEIIAVIKNKALISLIIPSLFTLIFIITEFGILNNLYIIYVIVSWCIYIINYLFVKNGDKKKRINLSNSK